jgi:hypothetical protein
MDRQIHDLQPKDQDWIARSASEGQSICNFYGVTPSTDLSPEKLDSVFHAWRNDSSDNRKGSEAIINGLGCLFGELLRGKFPAEWKILTDSYSTELALLVDTSGRTWELTPRDFVAKRVLSDEDESGFFAAMESMLNEEIKKGS